MNSRAAASLIVSLVLCCSSCGLIFQGRTEDITVESNPPGATTTMSDGQTRVTPFTITVPRNQDVQFHLSKPGFQSTDIADNTQIEPLYLVVDTIPLFIPWAVDASFGAGYAHQQTSVVARLDPAHGGDAPQTSEPSASASVNQPTASVEPTEKK